MSELKKIIAVTSLIYSNTNCSTVQICQVQKQARWPGDARWPVECTFIGHGSCCSVSTTTTKTTVLFISYFGFEPQPRTSCCVLGQDALLSQCLSLPRCMNGNRRIECWEQPCDRPATETEIISGLMGNLARMHPLST